MGKVKFEFKVGDFVQSKINNTFKILKVGLGISPTGGAGYKVLNLRSKCKYEVKVKDAHKRWRICTVVETVLYTK